jgi:hypothetical protein
VLVNADQDQSRIHVGNGRLYHFFREGPDLLPSSLSFISHENKCVHLNNISNSF